MDLLTEIIILLQTNIPGILTVIVGVLAARFFLKWRKFKRVLKLVVALLMDLDEALEDDAFSVQECQKILADIILIIKEIYNKHSETD